MLGFLFPIFIQYLLENKGGVMTDQDNAKIVENLVKSIGEIKGAINELKSSIENDDSMFRRAIKNDVRQILREQRMFLMLALLLPVSVLGLVAVICGICLFIGFPQNVTGYNVWVVIVLFLVGMLLALLPLFMVWKSTTQE
jgi:hypothetical protein